jgi:hypothetical protein
VLIAGLLLSACGEEAYNKKTMFLNVPTMDAQGEIAYQKVEVPTATDFDTLSGEHVSFNLGLTDLELVACEDSGAKNVRLNSIDIYYADINDYCSGTSIAKSPKFRFIRKGDTFTPVADFNALVATSLYYHTLKVKKIIEPYKSMVPNLFPIKIHLGVSEAHNNAGSYAGFNFLAFGYSSMPKLPVSLSPVVQYHEISHSIFYQILEQNLAEKYSKGYAFRYLMRKDGNGYENYVNLRSITEGLADLFAYIITGETSILGHTHDDYHAEDRDLDSRKSNGRPYTNNPYEVGTYFAKKFISLSLTKRKIKNLKPSLVSSATRSEFLDDYFQFIKTKVTKLYEGSSVSDSEIETAIDDYFQKQIEKEEKGNKDSKSKEADNKPETSENSEKVGEDSPQEKDSKTEKNIKEEKDTTLEVE